ncbi:hypothetical protein [Micromonospora sp. NPDC023888]|uniref:hypothetical protein n=1 Tax=Micromonospora sp. NPDC023888 TaxID=3155607 RepID=UPI0033E4854C
MLGTTCTRMCGFGEYRHDRLALTVYLATLQAEAGEQLPEVDPARLSDRFLSWTRARA